MITCRYWTQLKRTKNGRTKLAKGHRIRFLFSAYLPILVSFCDRRVLKVQLSQMGIQWALDRTDGTIYGKWALRRHWIMCPLAICPTFSVPWFIANFCPIAVHWHFSALFWHVGTDKWCCWLFIRQGTKWYSATPAVTCHTCHWLQSRKWCTWNHW